jgi:hypothetical protein
LYASATNTLSKLGIGTVNYILTSTGSVPQWVAPTSITVNTATNLAGGAAGSVPYQSGVATTTFLAIGAANTVMTSSGTAPQWGTTLTGLTGLSSSSITNTSLTSGRVVLSTTGGLEADSANLTFNGTTLSTTGLSNTGFSTLVKTLTLGDSNFNGTAVFAAATPAKLYIGTGTVTDVTSAASATNTTGAISSLAVTPIAATNTSVTYTNASTLYIAGAPSAGANVTITNPYSLYVAGGASYFGGAVDFAVTPSYSGGTANGVMYLNGSKQITTGTALVFDGTNLGVGITPTTTLDVAGPVRSRVIGGVAQLYLNNGATQLSIDNNSGQMVFTTAGAAEQMRLTSTGLGIGTSSPGQKLHVDNSANSSTWIKVSNGSNGAGAAAGVLFGNDGGDLGAVSLLSSGNSPANGLFLRTLSTNSLLLGTNNTVKATIDSAGNLGLGVTPSAWNSSYRVMQVGSGTVLSQPGAPAVMDIYANAYIDSAYVSRYIGTASASHYEQNGGQHRWWTAPSGNAGDPITFTQAMTLTSGKNLLIGTTANNYSASIITADPITTTWSGTIALRYNVSGQTNIYYKGMAGTSLIDGQARGLHIFNYDGDSNVGINFYPNNYAGQTANAAVTIASTNNVGFGTASPNTKLELRTYTTTAGDEPNILLNNRGDDTTYTTAHSIGGIYGGAFRDVRNPGYVAGINFYRDYASGGANSQGSILFYTITDAGTLAELKTSERARFTPAGKFLVGVSGGIGRVVTSTGPYADTNTGFGITGAQNAGAYTGGFGDVRLVTINGDGGTNTGATYVANAFGTKAVCIAAFDASGNSVSPLVAVASSQLCTFVALVTV